METAMNYLPELLALHFVTGVQPSAGPRQKCLSRRIRAILSPKIWQKLRQERGVLAVKIPVSAEVVLTLQINLERDKTGHVGKYHDTYIIHISKFMITRDHTLLIHQSIFATKTVWLSVV